MECRWHFPTPDEWPIDDDLVAVGADLEPDTVLWAYAHGMFPMHIHGQDSPLGWWSPRARGVIPLTGLHITRSMRQSARHFHCTINQAFEEVMWGCATSRDEGNWISPDFIEAYMRLHQMGFAHSVEAWSHDGQLVGGLYGIRIGRFFAGESMFHRARDASKVALAYLVNLMILDDMELLDTQWNTEHLASLGAVEVSRSQYLALLAHAVADA